MGHPLLSGLLCLGLAAPPGDVAGAAPVAASTRSDEAAPAIGVLSAGGSRRGGLEMTLGGVSVAVAAALLTFGGVELRRGRERERSCAREYRQLCDADPPNSLYAAGGLGIGLSVPVLIGGALLWARGARIHRDARQFLALGRASLSVTFARGLSGGLLRASVRF